MTVPEDLAAAAARSLRPVPPDTVLPCSDPAHGDECPDRRQAGRVVLPPILDVGALGPWEACACGHLMLLHDVEDMDGSNPTCCVDGCSQQGCGDRKGEQDAG